MPAISDDRHRRRPASRFHVIAGMRGRLSAKMAGGGHEVLPFVTATFAILVGCIVGRATNSVDLGTLLSVPGVTVAILLYSERVRCPLCGHLVRPTNVNRCSRCRASLPD
jgi:hypothetical protein